MPWRAVGGTVELYPRTQNQTNYEDDSTELIPTLWYLILEII